MLGFYKINQRKTITILQSCNLSRVHLIAVQVSHFKYRSKKMATHHYIKRTFNQLPTNANSVHNF